jgi:hypothetical protein
MRSPVTCGNAKSSSISDHNVSTPFPRRLQLGQGKKVCRSNKKSAEGVDLFSHLGEIADRTTDIGILNQYTTYIA